MMIRSRQWLIFEINVYGDGNMIILMIKIPVITVLIMVRSRMMETAQMIINDDMDNIQCMNTKFIGDDK